MTICIERLKYYERQHLLAFDLAAEQSYHIEMRRRLNRSLHLWGIVEGLQLSKSESVPGLGDQFHVTPGMAIDGYGREIVLFNPFDLSDEDFLDSADVRVAAAGTHPVWLQYDRKPSTPPTPGYGICDSPSQNTRWCESPRVLIGNHEGSHDSSELPSVTEDLSDDPADRWLILLGYAEVASDGGGGWTIVSAQNEDRVHIGTRTQRIVPVVESKPDDQPTGRTPIQVEADLWAQQDAQVGEPFNVDESKAKPTVQDISRGNLKVRNDIFVLGDLYRKFGDDWLGLGRMIKRLMPEIQVDTIEIEPSDSTGTPVQVGTVTFELTSANHAEVESAVVHLSLIGYEGLPINDLISWHNNASGSTPCVLATEVTSAVPISGNPKKVKVDVLWTHGPKDEITNPPEVRFLLKKITVSYLAVLYPKV